MKRYLTTLAAAATLCVPAAALAADGTPNASQLAVQSCKTQQAQAGPTFKATYGANAYGKCVSKAMQAARAALQNAAEQCTAERNDANFAASHSSKTFDAFYGDNSGKGKGSGSNAYGKCVSAKAKAANDAHTKAVVSAEKTCKTLRADKTAFAAAYGTKANAFGVCVSKNTKTS